jgi:hypothetical protein
MIMRIISILNGNVPTQPQTLLSSVEKFCPSLQIIVTRRREGRDFHHQDTRHVSDGGILSGHCLDEATDIIAVGIDDNLPIRTRLAQHGALELDRRLIEMRIELEMIAMEGVSLGGRNRGGERRDRGSGSGLSSTFIDISKTNCV